MKKPLTLGVAGLGTVGTGLMQVLTQNGARLSQYLGRDIVVAGVSARERTKDRGFDLSKFEWFDDPCALARSEKIDVFVELIGGEEGPARASVEAALSAGKHVVTANKALLAHYGVALARLAEANSVALNFEAAVAGGIPVIKAMRESLAANSVTRVCGILNGTCNYILTAMQEEGRSFDEVLKEAQAKGYAEADPTFDIGGFDAAHKLALLTSLAFGTEVDFEAVHVEGIDKITLADIEAADELGYRIKLLGVAVRTDEGIEARVHPTMVAKHSAIAEVSGVTNCVAIDGDFAGNLLLVGPGAGAEATASAVAGDIVDIARGQVIAPFLMPASKLAAHERSRLRAHHGAYYVRLSVPDKPGAMAAIATRMGDRDISLESIVQRRPRNELPGMDAKPPPGMAAPVILITHETSEEQMREALASIENDGKVASRPQMIRIEKL